MILFMMSVCIVATYMVAALSYLLFYVAFFVRLTNRIGLVYGRDLRDLRIVMVTAVVMTRVTVVFVTIRCGVRGRWQRCHQ